MTSLRGVICSKFKTLNPATAGATPLAVNAETVVAKCPRLDIGEMYVNRVCIIRSCPKWGTATERWGRNGAFSRTKVLEDEISASAEVSKISPR